MDEKEFEKLVGRKPERDDLERVNCDKVGQPGHSTCGFCTVCNKPKYECMGIHDDYKKTVGAA